MINSVKTPVFISLVVFVSLNLNSCKKDPTQPVVATATVSDITLTTATAGGSVTGDGGAEVTSRGVCWNTSENPATTNSKTSDGTGTGTFTSHLTQLTPGTKYYIKAFATNTAGTAYGSQQTFTTGMVLPAAVTTAPVNSITQTIAISGGNVTSDGGGAITARGVCWDTSQNPTTTDSKTIDGTGTGEFTSTLTGLAAGTIYFIRAYASNSAGTSYGNEMSFTTSAQIIDIDGNIYTSVIIGTQVWMIENLKTTKFKDNVSIPNILENEAWSDLTTPGFCWYNNDASEFKATYGALYNWYAVNTGKLCPAGWHVPSEGEWTILTGYLGGEGIAGGKLKEIGNSHWESPNTDAGNASGFTGLPGGYRWGAFDWIGFHGLWWSATEWDLTNAWHVILSYNYSTASKPYISKFEGLSVRCVKD